MTPICEQFVESLKIDVPTGQSASGPPVATFDGFGPVKIGMTKDQVLAVPGSKASSGQFSEFCVVNTSLHLQVLFFQSGYPSDHVGTILTAPGAMTDRGVGDGSTPQQIKAAYAGSEFTIDDGPGVGPMGTDGIKVKDASGRQIIFSLSSSAGPAAPPIIGADPGESGCRG
jgi:hypothetical protein